MGQPARVLLADLNQLVRTVIRSMIESQNDFVVVAEAHSTDNLLDLIPSIDHDLVVTTCMSIGSGICTEILQVHPEEKIVILALDGEVPDLALEVAEAGAMGFISSDAPSQDAITVIQAVSIGYFAFPATKIRRLVESGKSPNTAPDVALTQNELETLRLFALGRNYTEISEIVGRQPLSIRNRMYRIQTKVGVRNKAELLLWAFKKGIHELS